MHGYGPSTYGDAFADVYDDWYATVTDVAATVERIASLAAGVPGAPVLELGVGTGRLAIPLSARGVEVHGIDASAGMLARLRAKPGGERVHVTHGDMVTDLPAGPFGVVYAAYNTLFNVVGEGAQPALLRAVAARLAPGGALVVEAFVPPERGEAGSGVEVRSLTSDCVVLAVHRTDPARQVVEGHYIELSEAGGVRLRPWAARWATPAQLDTMAAAAGLALEDRRATWSGDPFTPDSPVHMSTYRTKVAHRA